MIPTTIFIHDGNKYLLELEMTLRNITRVIKRTSFEGEQLYGIFEGILFFDEKGIKQITRRDKYNDFIDVVLSKLENMNESDYKDLKNYLLNCGNISANVMQTRGVPLVPRDILELLNEETKKRFTSFVTKIYEQE